jgi:LPXTG-motif cell wall-anchored protein
MADTDPDELERRIAQTRAELAQTVDAIADRVSPKRVAERTVADVKSRAGHFVASVGDALGVTARPVDYADDPERVWEDERPDLAPVLIGIGAVLVVGAAIMLWRRRRRR